MTTRRKRARQSHALLNCDQFAELVCGSDDAKTRIEPHYKGFRGDLDAAREAWTRHRDGILEWWLGGAWSGSGSCAAFCDRVPPWVFVAGAPGTRPWAWWRFDAPDDAPAAARAVRAWRAEGQRLDPETDFLAERNLLLPGEAEEIALANAAR